MAYLPDAWVMIGVMVYREPMLIYFFSDTNRTVTVHSEHY